MKELTKQQEEELKKEANDIDYDFMVDRIRSKPLSEEQKGNLARYKALINTLAELNAEE